VSNTENLITEENDNSHDHYTNIKVSMDDATPTFENECSQAIKAYREYLLGQRTCENWDEAFYLYRTTNISNCEFTLIDINNDGIPELHFRARHYTIFSYQDGQVFKVYSTFKDAELLNNRAVYSDHWAHRRPTSAMRQYIEFGEDFQPHFSIFFDHDDEIGEGVYRIMYKEQNRATRVQKGEYEAITSPIVDYCTDPKNYDMIPWVNFGEWLLENADEYVPVEGIEWEW